MTEPIVVDPSVLVRAVLEADPSGLLARWKAGEVRLVMSREALSTHLVALSRLGASEVLLARWGRWLVHRSGIVWDDHPAASDSPVEVFLDLARRHGGALGTACPGLYEGADRRGVRLVDPGL